MLSKTKYSALCLLGTEVFYIFCIGYGLTLSGQAQELHRSLLQLVPGFSWGDPLGLIAGAVSLGVFALIAGWYIAWMHNTSLVS